jgi:hypothetical protein
MRRFPRCPTTACARPVSHTASTPAERRLWFRSRAVRDRLAGGSMGNGLMGVTIPKTADTPGGLGARAKASR